jgi:hypothetical protein
MLPGRRLGPVRHGGAGLGNLLLPWARALVYARPRGIAVEWPIWSQYYPEAWEHGDRDKRFYGTFFRRTADYAPPQRVWETERIPFRWFRKKSILKFSEDQKSDFEASVEPAVLCFHGLGSFYKDFLGHNTQIWDELRKISRLNLSKARERGRGAIGVHVRLRDFSRLGWATPIDWYVEQVSEIRKRLPHKRVVVFCDDGPRGIERLLAFNDVEYSSTSSNALLDLAHMSGVDGMIVGNGSTFSGWAIFFGGMPILTWADEYWPVGYWTPFCRLAIAVHEGEKFESDSYDRFVDAATSVSCALGGTETIDRDPNSDASERTASESPD